MAYPRSFTDEELLDVWDNCNSVTEVVRELYGSVGGGYFDTVKRAATDLNLDFEAKKKNTRDKTVKEYSKKKPLKRKLVRNRGKKCERCKRAEWQNKQVPLDLHRIDETKSYSECASGDVKLLCPNCHRLTDNWGYQK